MDPSMVMTVTPKPEDVRALLAAAEERRASAEALLEIGNYRDAVSRAYYAFFDAARALLLTRGFVTKTHKGVNILFELHFIKTGMFPKGVGRWLNRAEQAREEADYEFWKEVSKEQAETAIKYAREFIDEAKKVVTVPPESGT